MSYTIRKETLKSMEEELAAKQNDLNPFVREGDTTFMRHDSMCISLHQPGVMKVEFSWRGMLTYTMYEICDFIDGQSLTIAGIEGKMSVKVVQSCDTTAKR